jgi:hypothetical protein
MTEVEGGCITAFHWFLCLCVRVDRLSVQANDQHKLAVQLNSQPSACEPINACCGRHV